MLPHVVGRNKKNTLSVLPAPRYNLPRKRRHYATSVVLEVLLMDTWIGLRPKNQTNVSSMHIIVYSSTLLI